jgi:hypothetical protein
MVSTPLYPKLSFWASQSAEKQHYTLNFPARAIIFYLASDSDCTRRNG